MGKGKGHISMWIAKLRKGTMLFEFSGLAKKNAIKLLRKISLKLSFKTILIFKNV